MRNDSASNTNSNLKTMKKTLTLDQAEIYFLIKHNQSLSAINFMLEEGLGIDVNYQYEEDETLLACAIRMRNLMIVKLLLKAGAQVSELDLKEARRNAVWAQEAYIEASEYADQLEKEKKRDEAAAIYNLLVEEKERQSYSIKQ